MFFGDPVVKLFPDSNSTLTIILSMEICGAGFLPSTVVYHSLPNFRGELGCHPSFPTINPWDELSVSHLEAWNLRFVSAISGHVLSGWASGDISLSSSPGSVDLKGIQMRKRNPKSLYIYMSIYILYTYICIYIYTYIYRLLIYPYIHIYTILICIYIYILNKTLLQ